jgi:PAS domain S-box-containing protein
MSDPEHADGYGGALLIEAGAVLANSLDVASTMRQVASLIVPGFSDLCVIDLLDDGGSIEGVAVTAAQPGVAAGLEDLRRRRPLDPAGEHPVARVIRTGEPEFLPDLRPGLLRSFAGDPEHARFMTDNEYRSAIVAALVANGRTVGALSVLRLGASAPFATRDVELVLELARRAAVAIDNAALYSKLQRAERHLDAVFANVAEAITVVDPEGRTVLANRAAAELLGFERPEDLAATPSAEVIAKFIVRDEHGSELSLDDLPSRRTLRGAAVEPMLVQHIVRETGEERWLLLRSAPVQDPVSARPLFSVNVLENVTELKRTELGETFMAEASRLLASAGDLDQGLREIARIAVPTLADRCSIDIVRDDGPARIATTRLDPPRAGTADVEAQGVAALVDDVIRSGRALIATRAADGEEGEPSAGQGLLRAAGARAVLIAPVIGATRTVGAVTLMSNEAGRRLGARDLAVLERLARLSAERVALARTLQRALRPDEIPASAALTLEARYLGAGELNQIGGDFYDVIEREGGSVVLAIGDVCGKGAHAAGVAAMARHTLRAAAFTGQSPAAMLATVHMALRRHSTGAELCTVCLASIAPDADGAVIEIALAGHPPPLQVSAAGDVRQVGVPGTLLGIPGDARSGVMRAILAHGETLILYTDGVIDAGRPSAPLGERGLLDLVRGAAALSLPSLLERIEQVALARSGGTPRDDIALLAARLP